MALLGNYSVLTKSAGQFRSGSTVSDNRSAWGGSGRQRALFFPETANPDELTLLRKSGVPSGYSPPYTWLIPQRDGGLGSRREINGLGAVSAALLRVRRSSANIASTGSITTADLKVLVPLVSTLSGSGSVSAALRAVSGLVASLAGTGSISTAQLKVQVPLASTLAGVGSVSPNLKGRASLTADITPFTELSPQSLAAAVLNSPVEGDYTLEEAVKLILAAVAGKLSGAAGTTITIRSADDTKNRIVATVDSNGNRTAVTYDLTE